MKINLKFLIYRARLKRVPGCCVLLVLTCVVFRYFSWKRDAVAIRQHSQEDVEFSQAPAPQLSARELNVLKTTIEMLNLEREVFHERRWGRVRAHTAVLAVCVRRDLAHLQLLLASLARVRHIQSALIIFSHSFYDENINNLIRSVSFCRYMQIFYPYSVQLHPNKFPGIDPEDCLYSSTLDKYCSNRDARLTEDKHHWSWQAHFIFNRLDWSQKYKGTVIFLEEDSYVLPDILHMLRFAKRSLSYIPWVTLMSFGKESVDARELDNDVLTADTWRPPYDVGLAFNKSVWKKIAALSPFFCTYDDARWSYSLLNLFSNFQEGHVDMISTVAARVLKTSAYSTDRDARESIQVLMSNTPLFPTSVKAAIVLSSSGKVTSKFNLSPQANGGWSDIRDHLLCLDSFSPTEQTTDVTCDSTTVLPTFIIPPQINYSAQIILEDSNP